MDDTALSALMTPAPNKEFIENKSRMEHGKRVITADPKKDERDLTLQINLTALIKIHSLQGMTAFVMSWIKEYLK